MIETSHHAFPEPHLSHSRINRYLTCPEQYRLYYIENLRQRIPSANLIFGKIIHSALAEQFGGRNDAVTWFMQQWDGVLAMPITYSYRDTWETLRAKGHILLQRFLREELPRIGITHSAEQSFELRISGIELPFVGIIDLVADLDKKRTVVDFKTSSMSYAEHEAGLSDQLTAYRLAEPAAEQAALCVFVKTKDPKIEWYVTHRNGTHLQEYLAKVGIVAREIKDQKFYKRPGKWCGFCEFLPICMGDQAKANETLIQITTASD